MGRCVLGTRSWDIRLGSREGGPGCAPSASAGGFPWGSVPGAQHVPPREITGPSGLTKAKCPQASNIVVNSVHTPNSPLNQERKLLSGPEGAVSHGFHLRACLVPFHPQERKGYPKSLIQLRAGETAKFGLFFLVSGLTERNEDGHGRKQGEEDASPRQGPPWEPAQQHSLRSSSPNLRTGTAAAKNRCALGDKGSRLLPSPT